MGICSPTETGYLRHCESPVTVSGDQTMRRRDFLRTIARGTAGMALSGYVHPGAHAQARQGESQPNLVVIFTDDLGYSDLSCFGSETIKTPRVDRMADEGMKFTDFYVAAPVCTPSRAALMTGCYPTRVGMGGRHLGPNGTAFVVSTPASTTGLNPDEVTIAELLKGRGYATACIGKWHLGHLPPFLPRRHGFDYYYGIPYSNDMNPCVLMRNEEVIEDPANQATLTERYTDEAVRFITENSNGPFFLYLPHTMPHTPLHVSDRFAGKSEAGLYGDVVECLDWSTGRILDTLKELGLDDNTLVIFTSDNGPWLFQQAHGGCARPLRAGKGTTYEGGMRVPCVMRWPGKIPAGAVCSELATTMDLLPTLANLAGAEPPSDRIIDGKDIWPLMAGHLGAKSPTEAFYYYFMDSLQGVRSGQWKLMIERTRSLEYPFRHVLKRDVDRPDEVVPEALYNLDADVGEQHNVIDRYPEIAERLRGLMEQMRQEIGDQPVNLPELDLTESRSKIVEGRNCRPIGRT